MCKSPFASKEEEMRVGKMFREDLEKTREVIKRAEKEALENLKKREEFFEMALAESRVALGHVFKGESVAL